MAVHQGFSIMQFSFISFFSVLMSNRLTEPNFTDLIRLAETMAYAEEKVDTDLIKELDWIYDNTNEDIKMPLAQVEMLVFYQLHLPGTSLNKEVEINDKSYTIIQLYGFLDEVNQRLVKIVVAMAKKYSLDIPVNMIHGSQLKM